MPFLSLVVPVFNAASYIERCLASVYSQFFSDFECVIVDDGSTDDSFFICQKYARFDSRFKVYHQKNRGVSDARNLGLEKCRGDYICFMDADDQLSPDYFSSLISGLGSFSEVDLVIQGVSCVDRRTESVIIPQSEGFFNFSSNSASFFTNVEIHRLGFSFAKLYRSSIINQYSLRFERDVFFAEDLDFLLRYLRHCRFVNTQNIANYQYIHHAASAIYKINDFSLEYRGLLQLRDSWRYWTSRYPSQSLSDKEGTTLALLVQRCILSCYKPEVSFSERREYFKQIPTDCLDAYYHYIDRHTYFLRIWRFLFYYRCFLLLDVVMLFVFRVIYRLR